MAYRGSTSIGGDLWQRARSSIKQALPLLIDGKLVAADAGETYPFEEPSTGHILGVAADAGQVDVGLAVDAARRAFEGSWRRVNGAERARLLLRLADLIDRDAEELALSESLDTGMPLPFAKTASVERSAIFLRYAAGWADKLMGETIPVETAGQLAFTLREPVGVVAAIVPWNVPLVNAVGKLAQGLAAGCTIVLKPAEQTPLTTARLSALICEAGFPDGVVNVLTGRGSEVGRALVAHPDVDKVAFTGSTTVGRQVMADAAGTLKRLSLELGGKSPTIIFPDADLDRAIPAAAAGVFGNAGQVCIAGTRLFVHAAVYDAVIDALVSRARALEVGAPWEARSQMGPLISSTQRDRVLSYVTHAPEDGVEVLTGGGAPAGLGHFFEPTVLADGGSRAKVACEEIFGPVLWATRFEGSLEDVAGRANASDYGLSANVWTRDIGSALNLTRMIRSGSVRINGGVGFDPSVPFGGVKQSGLGRENGSEGVKAYTELKAVTIGL